MPDLLAEGDEKPPWEQEQLDWDAPDGGGGGLAPSAVPHDPPDKSGSGSAAAPEASDDPPAR
jgi:hypothetical protein